MTQDVTISKALRELTNAMSSLKLNSLDEATLQSAIETKLQELRLRHEREYWLTTQDRLDFLVGHIAIEVKVDGTLPSLTRQIYRYLFHDNVLGLLVVTHRSRLTMVPAELHGKPVRVALIQSPAF